MEQKPVSGQIVLVSACLVGLQTRYDGVVNPDTECLKRLKNTTWVPVCPEQLGGLPTPRCAADVKGGTGREVLSGSARVVCRDGTDVTASFVKGAGQVLEIATRQGISLALLKARSPSCGVSRLGVTAALLAENGIDLEEYG